LNDGALLKITNHFKHLGGVISKDSSLDKEIEKRTGDAGKVHARLHHRVWSTSELHKCAKIETHEACAPPMSLCVASTWTPRKD